jgi:serine protease Do
VHIDASRVEEDGIRRRRIQEAGSGVIVDLAGKPYVITNRHVIEGTPLAQIKVELDDGRILNPKRIWTDKDTDLAVMHIDADDLITARWATATSWRLAISCWRWAAPSASAIA